MCANRIGATVCVRVCETTDPMCVGDPSLYALVPCLTRKQNTLFFQPTMAFSSSFTLGDKVRVRGTGAVGMLVKVGLGPRMAKHKVKYDRDYIIGGSVEESRLELVSKSTLRPKFRCGDLVRDHDGAALRIWFAHMYRDNEIYYYVNLSDDALASRRESQLTLVEQSTK